jgi:DNA-binding IclR family transcriptional regulator
MAAPEAWHVGRTMRLLELLAFSPLSAPQLAAALHAQPRTVRRVLARLTEDGYVTYCEHGRRVYEPTMRLVALAGQIAENSTLAQTARPFVRLLHERTGGTAHLLVPSYQSVLCLVHIAASDADARPGLRELVPAHCTAGGKALLAWRERWRESVLAAPLQAYTDKTVTDPAELRRMLAEIRDAGHAVEDGEYRRGVRAFAAPVCVSGEAVAAVAGTGIRGRASDAIGAVESVARELAESLERSA